MPRVSSEKQYNTFVKGLITEANPLTYPENSSLDEDNFVLKRNGARERRLGIDYELGYALTDTGFAQTTLLSGKQSFHVWSNPGGDTSIVIGVVRVYNTLWFIDLLTTSPSANLVNGGSSITIDGLGNSELETAVINNFLVLVSKDLDDPVILNYNHGIDLVSQTVSPLQVRDFWGIVDGLSIDERPTTLSVEHLYNLINQGWNWKVKSTCSSTESFGFSSWFNKTNLYGTVDDSLVTAVTPVVNSYSVPKAVECMFTSKDVYPSNSDVWSIGKAADPSNSSAYQKFDPAMLTRRSVYSMEAPKGSFIISPYDRGTSRRNLLGDNTLPLDKEYGRVSTIASYAGRVFYSGVISRVEGGDGNTPNLSNYIFFSQVTQSSKNITRCYQEADPTSDSISDIIDTDGGTIQIPEAGRIVKLVPVKSSLLVLAENGVWEIFGDTQGFVATSFQISRLSSNGCTSPKSVVEANGTAFAWTKAGIYAYTEEPTSGRYKAENISLLTIQSAYNSLSEITKNNARGYYDEKENRIRWLYKVDD